MSTTSNARSRSISSVLSRAKGIAKREGRSVEAVLSKALASYLESKPSKGQPWPSPKRKKVVAARTRSARKDLWETIVGPFKDVPEKVQRKLPRDGSINHDRYIYGQP